MGRKWADQLIFFDTWFAFVGLAMGGGQSLDGLHGAELHSVGGEVWQSKECARFLDGKVTALDRCNAVCGHLISNPVSSTWTQVSTTQCRFEDDDDEPWIEQCPFFQISRFPVPVFF